MLNLPVTASNWPRGAGIDFEFDAALRSSLVSWIADARDAREFPGRNEAVGRVVRCAEQGSCALDLSNLELTALPPATFDMAGLLTLKLSGNRLESIPPELARLRNLRLLDLRNNQLHTLDENIRQLPAGCSVILTGNQLGPDERNRWATPLRGARHPRLIFDRPGTSTFAQTTASPPRSAPVHQSILFNRIQREIVLIQARRATGIGGGHEMIVGGLSPGALTLMPLHEVLTMWRLQAGGYGALLPRLSEPQLTALRTTPHARSFATWLLRLSETADYADVASRTLLNGRVFLLLQSLIADQDLRAVCFHIAHESVTSCGDRIALAVNQMEMAHVNACAEQGQFNEAQLFNLAVGRYRLTALEKISERHAQRLGRAHEGVEVHMAYQVGLRSRLSLPLGNRNMLYRASAHVQDKDLEEAAAEIEAMEKQPAAPLLAQLDALRDPETASDLLLAAPQPHPLAYFMAAHFTPWQHAIERSHSPAIQRHTDLMYDCLEALTVRLTDARINEAQYCEAMDAAMFQANHGIAYARALELIAANQASA